MSIFLEDLKAKALAATPGEWTLRDRGVICGGPVTEYFRGKGQPQIVMCCGGEQIGHEQKTANEHFIVAARPEVVLDLLERLENSESERDALKVELSHMVKLKDELCTELEAARKQEPFMWAFMFPNGDIAKEHFFDEFSANICWLYRVPSGRAIPCYASPVPAQQSETLEVLSSAIDTLKTVAGNCEWSHSDFPVIARAEKLLQETPCTE